MSTTAIHPHRDDLVVFDHDKDSYHNINGYDFRTDKHIAGRPINSHTFCLARALMLHPKFRGCKLAVHEVDATDNGIRQLYILFPNDMIAAGVFGFRDITATTTVYKPFIAHTDILSSRLQYYSFLRHIKASINNDVLVKAAVKLFKPSSPETWIKAHSGGYTAKLNGMRAEYNEKVDKGLRGLRDALQEINGDLTQELLHIHASGYEYRNAAVKQLMEQLVSAHGEDQESKTFASPKITTVTMLPDTTERRIAVVSRNVVINRNRPDMTLADTRPMLLEDLPESLSGPLYMLHMVDKNTLVEGVGYKKSENVYYIYESLQ